MNTLEQLKIELDKEEVFSTPLPSFLTDLTKTIVKDNISDKMKLTIAVSELILFASQFRRNILHPNGSKIPINAITFCIAASGAGKDSSVNAMRKNFKGGYEIIQNARKEIAKENAIRDAQADKKANAHDENVYMKYYSSPMPLFTAPSTNEGYIAYLNRLDDDGIGAGSLFSGELANELQTSSVFIQNLQLISEMYDEGKKEVKVIKDKDRQSAEIKNLPVSALFMGSPDIILYEEDVKKKFKLEFSTKLARRSFFNFNPTPPARKVYESINNMLADKIAKEDEAFELSKSFSEKTAKLAKLQIQKLGQDIPISKEARKLLITYQMYCEYLAETIKTQYPMTKITRTHMYWKALKLAGAFALLRNNAEITELDYKQAVVFTELLGEDLKAFETELIKEPYELFVSLVQTILVDNKCFVDLHTLKKLGYIGKGTSGIAYRLKELAVLAASFDTSGVYKPVENGIEYSKIVKTNVLGVSYLEVSGSKEQRRSQCSKGFTYAETDFKALGTMLKKDFAYSPFKFKDGTRSSENILGACKWVALDIDESEFTDEQTHEMLANFNHHIVRTSDKNNAYKFRVLLELDSFVDLDEKSYKAFIASICESLYLKADILPKSQIYFSYKDRNVLSVIDKEPIETRLHLINAYAEKKPVQPISDLNAKQRKALLDNKFDTFHYAFEAKDGEGSVSLIRAAKHAKDLGMSQDEVLDLMTEINEYWIYPMEQSRFEKTILNQIRGWNFA